MDVVLGVAVTGPVARLALVGSGASGADVIDQSVVALDDNPIRMLAETVVGTDRLLADERHRLVATRLCWSGDPRADQLRQTLENSGVHNVAVLSESQAVAALMRAAGHPGAALVMDDATATLRLVDTSAGDENAPPTVLATQPVAGADTTAALETMMAELTVGPEDPTFALARGAAIAAAPAGGRTGDETAMAPAVGLAGGETAMAPAVGLTGDETTIVPASEFADPDAQDQQLAYSLADEEDASLGDYDEYDDYGDFADAEEGPARLSRRSLLIGNAVIAFAIVGVASLAAAVVIAVRPTASEEPVVGHQNAAPGKFMPLLPTQQQAPVPLPPADAPNAGFQGGIVPAPASGGLLPQPVTPPGAGVPGPIAPAPVGPETPGTPGFVPNPNPIVPLPIPIIVPYPGWRPGYPPRPPYPPPTTTYAPPTTSYEPPTTSYEPPTTTSEPPTTTYSPPTTTSAPPTTTHQPPTTTSAPPTTSNAPPTTTYSPPTHTPTQPPTQTQPTAPPTHSPQPVAPQEPHGGGGHHGF